jgi:GntR family transcriptional repressor for pyruvate dehydrogenase complex
LIDAVAELVYEGRRQTAERATDLKESAEMHRRIYRAVRARDPEAARLVMTEHLQKAQHAQSLEARRAEDERQ